MEQRNTMVKSDMALLTTFWQSQYQMLEGNDPDFKNHPLPLARIKKVMRTDEDVRQMVQQHFGRFIFR